MSQPGSRTIEPGPAMAARGPWIRSARWDAGWLIASAAVVPAVLVCVWLGASSTAINLGVTALVGAPHVWATFLATYGDPRFRRSHRSLLAASTVLVPATVIAMTLVDFQVLLSVFIFAASAHVLQQNAYLVDVYRRRGGRTEPAWFRWADYGFLGLSFYPVAAYKLVHDDFYLGDVKILIPSVAKLDATWMAISTAFAAFALAWTAKTLWELRRGRLNGPKTLLIVTTAVIAFLVPLCSAGSRLELAFQSVNMWHSIQYLGIVWLVLKLHKDRGAIRNRFVASVSGSGNGWRYYGVCFLLSAALFSVIVALVKTDPLAIRDDQYYYMVVLSALLIHYVLDAYLFAACGREKADLETIPYMAPSVA